MTLLDHLRRRLKPWRGCVPARHGYLADGQPPVCSRATASSPGPVLPPIGRAHVADALLARCCRTCLVRSQGVQDFVFPAAAPIAAFAGLKAATGEMASQWFHDPSHALQVLAVTGTNGKTSSTWWLAEALNLLSKMSCLRLLVVRWWVLWVWVFRPPCSPLA